MVHHMEQMKKGCNVSVRNRGKSRIHGLTERWLCQCRTFVVVSMEFALDSSYLRPSLDIRETPLEEMALDWLLRRSTQHAGERSV